MRTGEVKWEAALPGSAHATPMSYVGKNGKQYVLITVPTPSWRYPRTAAGESQTDDQGGYVIAYALPDARRSRGRRTEKQKARSIAPGLFAVLVRPSERGKILLDLAFLELDVLAHDRIVLLENELLRLRARVLLRDVEEAGVGRRVEADLDGWSAWPWSSRTVSENSEACLDRRAGLKSRRSTPNYLKTRLFSI